MDQEKAVFSYHNSDRDTSDFVLECMRQGRMDLIRNFTSKEKQREMIEQVFGEDRACALRAFIVLWVEAGKIAEELGLPAEMIDKNLEKCIEKSNFASTPWELSLISEDYIITFAEMISEMQICDSTSPIYRKFIRYIRSHIGEPLRLDEIASALKTSKSYLSHQIKQETSYTVRQWIMMERINTAKIMLSNPAVPMRDVWQNLGFCSQSHFAKCFKSATTMSPSEFRTRVFGR